MNLSKNTRLLASTFLVNDADITVDEMVEKIVNHKNQHDNIDYVDGVVVWENVENSLTCKEFLETIGYGERDTEMRVFLVDIDQTEDDFNNLVTDDVFIDEAEKQGSVYTLNGFQEAFNNNEISTENAYIRFIEVEI